jgi:hypothetical protein
MYFGEYKKFGGQLVFMVSLGGGTSTKFEIK